MPRLQMLKAEDIILGKSYRPPRRQKLNAEQHKAHAKEACIKHDLKPESGSSPESSTLRAARKKMPASEQSALRSDQQVHEEAYRARNRDVLRYKADERRTNEYLRDHSYGEWCMKETRRGHLYHPDEYSSRDSGLDKLLEKDNQLSQWCEAEIKLPRGENLIKLRISQGSGGRQGSMWLMHRYHAARQDLEIFWNNLAFFVLTIMPPKAKAAEPSFEQQVAAAVLVLEAIVEKKSSRGLQGAQLALEKLHREAKDSNRLQIYEEIVRRKGQLETTSNSGTLPSDQDDALSDLTSLGDSGEDKDQPKGSQKNEKDDEDTHESGAQNAHLVGGIRQDKSLPEAPKDMFMHLLLIFVMLMKAHERTDEFGDQKCQQWRGKKEMQAPRFMEPALYRTALTSFIDNGAGKADGQQQKRLKGEEDAGVPSMKLITDLGADEKAALHKELAEQITANRVAQDSMRCQMESLGMDGGQLPEESEPKKAKTKHGGNAAKLDEDAAGPVLKGDENGQSTKMKKPRNRAKGKGKGKGKGKTQSEMEGQEDSDDEANVETKKKWVRPGDKAHVKWNKLSEKEQEAAKSLAKQEVDNFLNNQAPYYNSSCHWHKWNARGENADSVKGRYDDHEVNGSTSEPRAMNTREYIREVKASDGKLKLLKPCAGFLSCSCSELMAVTAFVLFKTIMMDGLSAAGEMVSESMRGMVFDLRQHQAMVDLFYRASMMEFEDIFTHLETGEVKGLEYEISRVQRRIDFLEEEKRVFQSDLDQELAAAESKEAERQAKSREMRPMNKMWRVWLLHPEAKDSTVHDLWQKECQTQVIFTVRGTSEWRQWMKDVEELKNLTSEKIVEGTISQGGNTAKTEFFSPAKHKLDGEDLLGVRLNRKSDDDEFGLGATWPSRLEITLNGVEVVTDPKIVFGLPRTCLVKCDLRSRLAITLNSVEVVTDLKIIFGLPGTRLVKCDLRLAITWEL
ncbi:hypothetical protein C8J56DRAFT_886684 [Mycena floridula]|nr:hypothetical protein C8J56DRAFT_886684 [Mycena floridula]